MVGNVTGGTVFSGSYKFDYAHHSSSNYKNVMSIVEISEGSNKLVVTDGFGSNNDTYKRDGVNQDIKDLAHNPAVDYLFSHETNQSVLGTKIAFSKSDGSTHLKNDTADDATLERLRTAISLVCFEHDAVGNGEIRGDLYYGGPLHSLNKPVSFTFGYKSTAGIDLQVGRRTLKGFENIRHRENTIKIVNYLDVNDKANSNYYARFLNLKNGEITRIIKDENGVETKIFIPDTDAYKPELEKMAGLAKEMINGDFYGDSVLEAGEVKSYLEEILSGDRSYARFHN